MVGCEAGLPHATHSVAGARLSRVQTRHFQPAVAFSGAGVCNARLTGAAGSDIDGAVTTAMQNGQRALLARAGSAMTPRHLPHVTVCVPLAIAALLGQVARAEARSNERGCMLGVQVLGERREGTVTCFLRRRCCWSFLQAVCSVFWGTRRRRLHRLQPRLARMWESSGRTAHERGQRLCKLLRGLKLREVSRIRKFDTL